MYRNTVRRVDSWLHLSSFEFKVILLFLNMFMGAAMLFVWANVQAVRQAYEYQVLKRENHRLEKKYRLLALEKESLKSLYRIQELARNRMGMKSPGQNQIITIFLN